MPRATVSQDVVRKDLQTLPEGYVVLRRLSYGEFMKRQQMAMDMVIQGDQKNAEAAFKMANDKVAEYEFRVCIVEHNLEDADGYRLDFKYPNAVHVLDPRIGQEIAGYIDELNQVKEELGNSPTRSEGQ